MASTTESSRSRSRKEKRDRDRGVRSRKYAYSSDSESSSSESESDSYTSSSSSYSSSEESSRSRSRSPARRKKRRKPSKEKRVSVTKKRPTKVSREGEGMLAIGCISLYLTSCAAIEGRHDNMDTLPHIVWWTMHTADCAHPNLLLEVTRKPRRRKGKRSHLIPRNPAAQYNYHRYVIIIMHSTMSNSTRHSILYFFIMLHHFLCIACLYSIWRGRGVVMLREVQSVVNWWKRKWKNHQKTKRWIQWHCHNFSVLW